MKRTIKAPTGTKLTCKNWLAEAAYRMIQNNLDPDVAFDPDNLIVYGGRGKAARNWESFDAILESSEKSRSRRNAARPIGQTRRRFQNAHGRAESSARQFQHRSALGDAGTISTNTSAKGLMMYGQMTAGSWIYIGTQGILQGTYETFGSLARQNGWGTLAGKFVLTAGLGEMGGAQAQAITFNGGVGLLVEVDRLAHRTTLAVETS